jgi:hypothetical protein
MRKEKTSSSGGSDEKAIAIHIVLVMSRQWRELH